MYELIKIGKVFTSKFVGTWPSSYKKKNLPGHGLTKVEKHYATVHYGSNSFVFPLDIQNTNIKIGRIIT